MESVAKVVVLYGSETGTAEQEAKMLSLQIRERGYDVEVAALDDYPLVELPETKYALFLVSTTGRL